MSVFIELNVVSSLFSVGFKSFMFSAFTFLGFKLKHQTHFKVRFFFFSAPFSCHRAPTCVWVTTTAAHLSTLLRARVTWRWCSIFSSTEPRFTLKIDSGIRLCVTQCVLGKPQILLCCIQRSSCHFVDFASLNATVSFPRIQTCHLNTHPPLCHHQGPLLFLIVVWLFLAIIL